MASNHKYEPLPPLGTLELELLEILWVLREASVQEAHSALSRHRDITANTVGSALTRLFRKSLLARKKVSRRFHYRPALSRKVFVMRKLVHAAGNPAHIASKGVIAAFIDRLPVDFGPDALNQLTVLIGEKRKNRG